MSSPYFAIRYLVAVKDYSKSNILLNLIFRRGVSNAPSMYIYN